MLLTNYYFYESLAYATTPHRGYYLENTRHIVATGYIGCSGKAVQTFNKLLSGDLVLVRYGAQVVALVAVEDTPHLLRDYEKHPLRWFTNGCPVKTLAYYENLNIAGRGW